MIDEVSDRDRREVMRRRSEPMSESMRSVRALPLCAPSFLLLSLPSCAAVARFAERPLLLAHRDPSEAGRCLMLQHVYFKKRC